MALVTAAAARAVAAPQTTGWEIVRRNFIVYKASWLVFLTGFLEPVLYLFSIGIGVGQMVDGFEFNGQVVSYAAFVAPAMLAASAGRRSTVCAGGGARTGSVLEAGPGSGIKLSWAGCMGVLLAR